MITGLNSRRSFLFRGCEIIQEPTRQFYALALSQGRIVRAANVLQGGTFDPNRFTPKWIVVRSILSRESSLTEEG